MKYYISLTGEVYAYNADGSQDHLINESFRKLSEHETSNHLSGYKWDGSEWVNPNLQHAERQWRDGALTSVIWLRERHRDQLEIATTSVLTAEQFTELLVYMQALRDWPQSEHFPDSQHRPTAPAWLPQAS